MIGTFQRLELSIGWKLPTYGNCRGFTLIELLVVMAIIGILAGLGVGGYRLARRAALEGRAQAEIELLRTALEEYRVEYGSYPRQVGSTPFFNLAEISTLTNLVEGIELLDPWERPYWYESTNRFLYSIWSEGVDTNTPADDINPSQAGY
ncbi:prepilin-type N-terminal cleavage/methylation domain-containing protein [Pontiellaceae bacterium B12227]|nr:prepilin-type N-terminal cleavage/methylation domain-containing protein [Pontiellaceae bacterium B12227]